MAFPMKEIKAYCRREMVEGVVQALYEAGVPHCTIVHVRSLDRDLNSGHGSLSLEAGAYYLEHVKLEVVVPDSEVDDIVGLIREKARTGAPGDGLVFVSPVDRALKIRTGEENL